MDTKINIVLFTTDQVCEILKISKRTCQSYRDRKIITFIQYGRKILYTEESLKAFLEAHHIKATCQKGGV